MANSDFTKDGKFKLIGGFFAITKQSEVWLGLSSTLPGGDGGFVTEPNIATGYERVCLQQLPERSNAVNNLEMNKDTGVVSNIKAVMFNEALKEWGTLPYWCLFDGSYSGAKLLAWGTFASPLSVRVNSVPLIRANELQLTFTATWQGI